MNNSTVTMPLNEYNRMRDRLHILEEGYTFVEAYDDYMFGGKVVFYTRDEAILKLSKANESLMKQCWDLEKKFDELNKDAG